VEELAQHRLIGFTQAEPHNTWPIWRQEGELLHIKPDLAASSGETIRQLVLAHQGIARMSDFVTHQDVANGRLVQVLEAETRDVRLPVNAVYYRNSTLSSRITCFLDFLQQKIDASKLL